VFDVGDAIYALILVAHNVVIVIEGGFHAVSQQLLRQPIAAKFFSCSTRLHFSILSFVAS
jgi:uncharacterized membrane protein